MKGRVNAVKSQQDKCRSFDVGDLVFAQVKGHPVWPARVLSQADSKGSKYKCFFYGTRETGVASISSIHKYNRASIKVYGKQKKKGFAGALKELETTPDIAYNEVMGSEYQLDKSCEIKERRGILETKLNPEKLSRKHVEQLMFEPNENDDFEDKTAENNHIHEEKIVDTFQSKTAASFNVGNEQSNNLSESMETSGTLQNHASFDIQTVGSNILDTSDLDFAATLSNNFSASTPNRRTNSVAFDNLSHNIILPSCTDKEYVFETPNTQILQDKKNSLFNDKTNIDMDSEGLNLAKMENDTHNKQDNKPNPANEDTLSKVKSEQLKNATVENNSNEDLKNSKTIGYVQYDGNNKKIKPFKCNTCVKRFARKCHLAHHANYCSTKNATKIQYSSHNHSVLNTSEPNLKKSINLDKRNDKVKETLTPSKKLHKLSNNRQLQDNQKKRMEKLRKLQKIYLESISENATKKEKDDNLQNKSITKNCNNVVKDTRKSVEADKPDLMDNIECVCCNEKDRLRSKDLTRCVCCYIALGQSPPRLMISRTLNFYEF